MEDSDSGDPIMIFGWAGGAIIVLAAALLAVMLGGCGFAQGFKDEGLKQAAELGGQAASAALEKKFGDKFGDVTKAISEIPAKLPQPAPDDPVKETAGYCLGALLAYIVGSLGKGYLRERGERRPHA